MHPFTTLFKYIKITRFDLTKFSEDPVNTNGYKSLFDEAVDWSYWVFTSKIFEHNLIKAYCTMKKIGHPRNGSLIILRLTY